MIRWRNICSKNMILYKLFGVSYKVKESAAGINNEKKNEVHQKKLDDVANLNNQAVVNYQNELIKGIIFK